MSVAKNVASLGLGLLLAISGHGQTRVSYDLASGDHLVYHESVDRTIHDKSGEFVTHAEWTNHLLVVQSGSNPKIVAIGVQRNRTVAELSSSKTDGKNTLPSDRKSFEARLAGRGTAFVEANTYDRLGAPQGSVTALREWTSQVLFDVRELMPLPASGIAIGSTWREPSLLGITAKYAGEELLHGEDCLRIAGDGGGNTVELRMWFCPSSGLMEKVELGAKYPLGEGTGEEKISFELTRRTRGESTGDWLRDADTRQAVLQLAMLDDDLPIDRSLLLPLLDSNDEHESRRVLALWYRRKFAAPSKEALSHLILSPDARVRTLTTLLATADEPVHDRAAKDSDYFVRHAASPEAKPACATKPRPHLQMAPGDYWVAIQRGADTGWPFIVHIPDDYDAQRTSPMILYLSGGSGRATDAMYGARDTEEATGYVLVYPQARGPWWEQGSIDVNREILAEVKELFAVDPDRVYLTGMSNGGTGALLYATLWPDQFAAAAPMMGAGFDTPAKEKPLGENTSALPLLFVHGDQDKIVPMASSEQAVERLKGMDRSAPVELAILPGKGHEIGLDDNGGRVLPFLQRFERNAYPHKLHVRLRTLDDPREYWIEVLEKRDGVAEIDTKIEGNVVNVKSKNVRKLRLLLRPEIASGAVSVVWNGKPAWSGSIVANCEEVVRSAPGGEVALGFSQEVVLEEKSQ